MKELLIGYVVDRALPGVTAEDAGKLTHINLAFGVIRDGQHRACCIASKYGLDYEIEVMEIENIDRIYLIKRLIPRPAARLYYKKRYGVEPLA